MPPSAGFATGLAFYDATAIRRALDFPSLIEALEAAHRRPRMQVQDGLLGSERAQYFVRHAADAGRFFASKLITSFPANLAAGRLPAVQAVLVLFDATDGRPLAVMDGTEITYWRTAADSALGARLLARSSCRSLLVAGAGAVSRWLVQAHLAAHPSIERVRIWNRTPQRAAALAHALRAEGIDADPAPDLRAAVWQTDLVSACTRSREPIILGADLRPGLHLDLVGGYTPETREADDEAARRARVFVDLRESAFGGVGDILQPIASGAIRETDVLGDLYDLAGAKVHGRLSDGDITLFKNAGGGHLDLMTAELVWRRLSGAGAACPSPP
jgi:ornithine cyclodeaminase/alanine dehydrogenase-like protein (mu-crystallin family)